MSSRPQIRPHSVITNVSMGANITSAVTIIDDLTMVGYDVSWTAGSTPIGVMSVQVSNTYSQNADGSVRTAGNWTTLTLSSAANVTGNTGNGFIDVDATGAYAIRIVYTRTSGSGTMNAKICSKVA